MARYDFGRVSAISRKNSNVSSIPADSQHVEQQNNCVDVCESGSCGVSTANDLFASLLVLDQALKESPTAERWNDWAALHFSLGHTDQAEASHRSKAALGPQRPVLLEKYIVTRSPKALTLESSSVCNLRCVICPHSRGLVQRPRHFELTLLDKIRHAMDEVEWVSLHGIGEPLHSPAFWRALEVLSSREDVWITVNSNMTVLSDQEIEKLLQSRLSQISVSLDAATPKTYFRIRGFDLRKVIRNIERFIAARDAEARATPAIELNMTLMRENIEEVEEFVALAHRVGAYRVYLRQLNPGENYQITAKDGWLFDYGQQMLMHYPKLSNEKIRAAMTLAKNLGIEIKADANKDFFFEEPA